MFTEMMMSSGGGGSDTKTVTKSNISISAGQDYVLTISELSEIYAVIAKSSQSTPSIIGAIKNGSSYKLIGSTYYYINSVSGNKVSIHSHGTTTYTVTAIGI